MEYVRSFVGASLVLVASWLTLRIWFGIVMIFQHRMHHVLWATAALRGEIAEAMLLSGALLIATGIVLAKSIS